MTSTPEDDMIAAEYVIGTLDLAERSSAEARLKRDPAFAELVEAWQHRMSGLNDDYAAVPAPNLLPQIEARLFPQAPPRTKGWLGALIGFALTTAAAIAVLAVFVLTPAKPSLIADLSAEASPLHYSAALSDHELRLTRLTGDDPAADKDYELWLIVGDNAPVSLGLIGASYRVTLPQAEAGYILAITLEPKGGGPEGKPTGPIVAAGALKNT